MNFLKAFAKDEKGKYITKKNLQDLKNGDLVQIFNVKTGSDVIIFDDENHDSQKIHFNNLKDVFVHYLVTASGEQKSIRLDSLKQVKFSYAI